MNPMASTKPNGHGEVVVITGASAGVGRATAREFARREAKIGLLARGPERLEAARREVEAAGGKALALTTDVAEHKQVESAAQTIEDTFGPIDIWINNAMVSVFSPIIQMEPQEFRRVTDVTYLGSVYGTLAALRRMLPRDSGHIIQVGSALAYRSIPLQSAYCAAKHALKGFTDSLRVELIHDNSQIRLTMVHLPALNTPQFSWTKTRMPRKAQPVPPIYQPEVAARAIVWAADNNRRELWVGWPTMQAILGNKLAPGYLDRKLAKSAVEGQQYNGPVDPDRPHNLWEPVRGDFEARGDFDQRSRDFSPQFWATTNRGKLGLAAGLVSAVLAGFFGLRRR
jgi:NAD(P)-dependent dehydrogenase (short-subunit alcohol dehydrogenase family)